MDIDLTALTLTQAFALLAIVALLDVGGSIAMAITAGTFELAAVGHWIQSHVLVRVFPIFALAVLGHGVDPYVPAIVPAWGLAIVALTAYVLETVGSLTASARGDNAPPVD
jgi:hypothetical protein